MADNIQTCSLGRTASTFESVLDGALLGKYICKMCPIKGSSIIEPSDGSFLFFKKKMEKKKRNQ